jgi:hypothetical protein
MSAKCQELNPLETDRASDPGNSTRDSSSFPFALAGDPAKEVDTRLLIDRLLHGDTTAAGELRRVLAYSKEWLQHRQAILELAESPDRTESVLKLALGIGIFTAPDGRGFLTNLVATLSDYEIMSCGKDLVTALRMSDELALANVVDLKRDRLVKAHLARVEAQWGENAEELTARYLADRAGVKFDLLSLIWLKAGKGQVYQAQQLMKQFDESNVDPEVLETQLMLDLRDNKRFKAKETAKQLWSLSEPKGLSFIALWQLRDGALNEFEKMLDIYMFFRKSDPSLLNSLMGYCQLLGVENGGAECLKKTFAGLSQEFVSGASLLEQQVGSPLGRNLDQVLESLHMSREELFETP